VYLVTGEGDVAANLYAGETLNLRARLQLQFGVPGVLDLWRRQASGGVLQVCWSAAEPRPPELLAYQSLLVRDHAPRLNFPELAA
jgi:hypothetical protein